MDPVRWVAEGGPNAVSGEVHDEGGGGTRNKFGRTRRGAGLGV